MRNIFLMNRTMKRVEVTEDGAPLASTLIDTELDIINDPREMDRIRDKRKGHKDQSLENGLNNFVS